jgi:hypothetical protein
VYLLPDRGFYKADQVKITQSKREGEYQVWRRSRSCNINAADGWSKKTLPPGRKAIRSGKKWHKHEESEKRYLKRGR